MRSKLLPGDPLFQLPANRHWLNRLALQKLRELDPRPSLLTYQVYALQLVQVALEEGLVKVGRAYSPELEEQAEALSGYPPERVNQLLLDPGLRPDRKADLEKLSPAELAQEFLDYLSSRMRDANPNWGRHPV